MEKVNLYFPEKTLNINENDQPWVDSPLLRVDKLRKREYNKRKKSKKWKNMDKLFSEMADQLKEHYYTNMLKASKLQM